MKHIDELPPSPHRFFPDHAGRRRRVDVVISLFRGYGHHFHVELIEEHNHAWDHEAGEWIVPEGDEEGAGLHRVMRFSTERHARRWIDALFAESFTEQTHELCIRGEVGERWLYREGD